VHDLAEGPTPLLVVDEEILERNISEMAARAKRAGVDLWPHFKTHKCLEIARRQRAAGAVGFTISTLHEGEVLAAAGFDRLLLAQPPVAEWRVTRLVELTGRVAELRVTIDSLEAAASLGDARFDVLWEVDAGLGRTGTPPGEATARAIAQLPPNLRFRGLLTFAGHAYAAQDAEGVRDVARQEEAAMASTLAALPTEAGRVSSHSERIVGPLVVSVGSTPTMRFLDEQPSATEIRPGNYVYRDATQVVIGVAEPDECALSVIGTVTARPTPTRAILDCGSKALAAEKMSALSTSFGFVRDQPGLRVARLFEEHAIIEADDPFELAIGTHVNVIPNHSCTAANLHERITVVRDSQVVDEWTIDARGWG
jgi:D-serine deaminase-like pyridoxal phosphate-dependent protein